MQHGYPNGVEIDRGIKRFLTLALHLLDADRVELDPGPTGGPVCRVARHTGDHAATDRVAGIGRLSACPPGGGSQPADGLVSLEFPVPAEGELPWTLRVNPRPEGLFVDPPPAILEPLRRILGAAMELRQRLRGLNSPFSEERHARYRHQRRLSQFQEQARLELGGRSLLDAIVAVAAEIADARVAQLFVPVGSEPSIRLLAAHGVCRRLSGHRRAVAGRETLAWRAFGSGAPVLIPDWSRESTTRTSSVIRRERISCSMALPVGTTAGVYGVLVLHWQGNRQLRAGDLHFAQSISLVAETGLKFHAACRELSRAVLELVDRAERQRVPWTASGPLDQLLLRQDDPPVGELNAAARRGELWSGEVLMVGEARVPRRLRLSLIPRAWSDSADGPEIVLCTDVSREHWLQEQVRLAEVHWRSNAQGSPIGVALVDSAGNVLIANQTWKSRRERGGCLKGWSCIGRAMDASQSCSHPVCSALATDLSHDLRDVAHGRRTDVEREYRCLTLGVERWFAIRLEAIGGDPAGDPLGAVVEWDITSQHAAREEMQRVEAGAIAVLRSSADAVLSLNHRGVIESVNPAAAKLFGCSEDELVGRRFQQLVSPDRKRGHDPGVFRAASTDLACLVGPERETRVCHASGVDLDVSLAVIETVIGFRPNYTVILRDLSEQRRVEAQVERLTFHDPVTGLPNRLLFRDRLDLALDHAKNAHTALGLLFLNINRFKRINESWGHEVGDRFLAAVARRLETNVRTGDLVARWSGDEYNVLLPRIRGPEEGLAVANRIREALRAPVEVEGKVVYASATIGLSTFPRDGLDADSLIRHADMAMYRAKRRGVEIGQPSSSDSRGLLAADLHLDAELHRAVDRGEFTVYYQPEVELATGKIIGAEALVRWQHPRHGILQPNVFIGLAERTGLIIPIGRQVIDCACRQLIDWEKEGWGGLRVAANLSPRQLRDPRLASAIAEAIGSAGVQPGRLTLEVTETTTINAAFRRARVLDDLKMLGVRLALDDFGKGYSSLSRLRRLPVDTLKIDRSFVRRICRSPKDAAIVRAIIQMGHSFGLSLVAEGVTSQSEVEFLRSHGCETAQGFLYSRPVPADEFLALRDRDLLDRRAA